MELNSGHHPLHCMPGSPCCYGDELGVSKQSQVANIAPIYHP